jgi:hypothetical protein
MRSTLLSGGPQTLAPRTTIETATEHRFVDLAHHHTITVAVRTATEPLREHCVFPLRTLR